MIAALAVLPVAPAADITGVVTFKGTPPPEADYGPKMTEASPDCAAMYDPAKMPTTHFYVVGPERLELADVVVSLKNVTGKSTGASSAARGAYWIKKAASTHRRFSRSRRGRKSSSKIPTTASTTSIASRPCRATKNPTRCRCPAARDLTFTFPQPEPFLKFQCDVHPWMFAWVSVIDSPYFAVSGKDGKFTIKNVPPGKYTIEASHRKLGAQTQEIEVKGGDVTVNFPAFEVK